MQLKDATGGAYIPGVDITDYPPFKLRRFMHDVGRSFISYDELKKEIDMLSRFKINVFHWHLTDKQGFRFESKSYPQLNQAANMTRFAGSFYTQEQCTELEAYAAERGVIIIPEIDMPGHSACFTTAQRGGSRQRELPCTQNYFYIPARRLEQGADEVILHSCQRHPPEQMDVHLRPY